MSLEKIIFKNIPEETAIAVFGIREDQWTVRGDPEHVYFSDKVDGKSLTVKVNQPATSRILIRIRSKKYKWRVDKEFKNPETGQYSTEIVLLRKDEEPEKHINLSEYLQVDSVSREIPSKTPSVEIIDRSFYPPKPKLTTTTKPIMKFGEYDPDVQRSRHLVATLSNFPRQEFEDFRHRLPISINWLLYIPLPTGNGKLRIVFFYYRFGRKDIDNAILKEEPWRLEESNQKTLDSAREEFVEILKKYKADILFLSTRELKELDGRFFQEDFPFNLPQIAVFGDKRPFWRYFSFPKFVDLITTSSLWFAKPSTFSDPFESKTNQETRTDLVWRMMNRLVNNYNLAVNDNEIDFVKSQEWFIKELEKDNDGTIKPIKYNSLNESPETFRVYAEEKLDELLDSILINSWHINSKESDAMWRLYTNNSEGVAIVSSFERLSNSFQTEYSYPQILKIEYHDLHSSKNIFRNLPSAYKHSVFSNEEEVRIYYNPGLTPSSVKGMRVKVDLNKIIDKIILAPESQDWFERNVKWIITQAGYEFKIKNSVFKSNLF